MKDRKSKRLTGAAVARSLSLPALFCLILLVGPACRTNAGWQQVPRILSRIEAPHFPDRDFKVTDYGAVADGQTDCTEAFKKAISAAMFKVKRT